MFSRPIAIGLSPNTQADDVQLAFTLLLQPGKWRNGDATKHVEDWFRTYLSTQYVYSFNAGRSALLAIIRALNIREGDEVITQAFTCVAVSNAIIWAGATPIYVDVDETLNVDPHALEDKITKKTRAVIVQHTFGVPAHMEAIAAIAKKHKIYLIEDCAHALGATYKGKKLGTFGHAAMFSFGRDKAVSSVFGGVAVTTERALGEKLRSYHQNLSQPSGFWVAQQLLHPVLLALVLPLYSCGIGKGILFVAQKLSLLSRPVYSEEKATKQPADFPKQLPNALARLAQQQLAKLERFTKHRQSLAQRYRTCLSHAPVTLPTKVAGSVYLRFNIRVSDPSRLRAAARRRGIILGNWYRECIAPVGVSHTDAQFDPASVPRAQQAALESVNLPTYPTLRAEDVEKVCQIIIDLTESPQIG